MPALAVRRRSRSSDRRFDCPWGLVLGGLLASGLLVASAADDLEIDWGTFLGGSQRDMGWALTCDLDGNLLLAGETLSLDFPTTMDAYDRWHNGVTDTYLARFSAEDGALLYATVLGSHNRDVCRDAAVDALGNIYLAGSTNSPDFPVTADAPDPTYNGGHDLYLAKFDPSGRELLCATYIGGSLNEKTRGMVLLGPDLLCVTGFTESPDFPVTPGSFDVSHNGDWDVFVVIVDLSGIGVVAGTYLGGEAEEEAWDLAVDAQQRIYVTGYTDSPGYPITLQSYDPGWNYRWDVFVTRLTPNLQGLSYSTFVGGHGWDRGWRLRVDDAGGAYVAGQTSSEDFPTTPGAYDPSHNGGDDAFVLRLAPNGDALSFATLLGGRHADEAQALGVDPAGFLFLSGSTYSDDFPIVGSVPGPDYASAGDLFLAILSPDGGDLLASSFLGGCEWEEAYASRWEDGSLFVTGLTHSCDFPVSEGAYDTTWNGESDAFALRVFASTQFAGLPEQQGDDRRQRRPNGGGIRLVGISRPARADAEIRLRLPASARTRVALYDVAGRQLARLHEGILSPGEHRWDWPRLSGARPGSGIAYLVVSQGAQHRTWVLPRVR
ncbi:MAG: hypothetical protein GF330_07965 [Candidatus Eisenbacteria bacterium]|nr:hypothetical protein [Candidatus Eisenbacteria bacterium]